MEAWETLLTEDAKRVHEINRPFNPITGEGSIGRRIKIEIADFPVKIQYVPCQMMKIKIFADIVKVGSIKKYVESSTGETFTNELLDEYCKSITRIRCMFDFLFWAFMFAIIKNKQGGDNIHFFPRIPQRHLLMKLEGMRLKGKPIRLVLLKARQWGGSTLIELYIAWIQLVIKPGLNSNIVAHVKGASAEILSMYELIIQEYPIWMLHAPDEEYSEGESKWEGVRGSTNIWRIPQRNCKIKIGSAEKPDSARGGDSSLVHLSETAFWKKTENKTPEDIIRSTTSGILYSPLTLIVYESTANGTGNFFHKEYLAAKDGTSQFEALFIPWFEIEMYSLPFKDEKEKEQFAKSLWDNRNNTYVASDRSEPGKYLFRLFKLGATLAAINWYVHERSKYHDHADMAAEFPSDDFEAFKHSGARVFDQYKVEELRPACRPPKYVGDISGKADSGEEALDNLCFSEDRQGVLQVWQLPETFTDIKVTDRYLVVVDIGGRSKKADWSIITVFDRYWMSELNGKPTVVATWVGHIDMDLLAWKAAQIAKFYDDALLVIESNTLETKDKDHIVDGDQAPFILQQLKDAYDNLYARTSPEDNIREGTPVKYGFHTNSLTKPLIISFLIKCVRERLYIERDDETLKEYIEYERKQNGSYGNIEGGHDDRLMTRAIGLYICYNQMPRPRLITIKAEPVTSSHKLINNMTTI